MKRKYILLLCILLGSLSQAVAQITVNDTLNYSFSLYGQTRRFKVAYEKKDQNLVMHWTILRNMKWWIGTFTMTPASLENGENFCWLQPIDGQHLTVNPSETVWILSQKQLKQLKEKGKFVGNRVTYTAQPCNETVLGYKLLHAVDLVEGAKIWILDYPELPLIWRMQNNPVGINWKVESAHSRLPDNIRKELADCPEKTGSIYYAYPTPEKDMTIAPDGYQAFYISHYGRHGSRWITDDKRYTDVLDVFQDNELTPLGKEVKVRLDKVWADAKGNGGKLTPKGARQHAGIAERMSNHYPEVFKGSVRIQAYSSTSDRAIKSMNAFCKQLEEQNPSLTIQQDSDEKHMSFMHQTSPELSAFSTKDAPWRKDYMTFAAQRVKPHRLMDILFTHPENIKQPHELMIGLYWIASDMQDTDLGLSFYDLFTQEELFGIWQCINHRMYVCNGNAPLNKGLAAQSARPLLKHILAQAEEAIQNGQWNADLRFGHDTDLLRLLNLMQIENCANKEKDPEKYHLAWQDFRLSPMAGNLQLIFYRNEKGDVRVKVLHNEPPVTLPINDEHAPYYRWEVIKDYWTKSI